MLNVTNSMTANSFTQPPTVDRKGKKLRVDRKVTAQDNFQCLHGLTSALSQLCLTFTEPIIFIFSGSFSTTKQSFKEKIKQF